VTVERAAPARRHLDAATLAGLGARERSLLVHVAGCAVCRRRLSAEERDRLAPWTPDAAADAAILRLFHDLESEADLDAKLAAIARERREAVERVHELLANPDSWGTAATEPRYGSVEVAWQLLEAARQEEPPLALRLLDLAGEIATVLAGHEFSSLHRQLLVEVRCARTHRLLDAGDHRAAARELRRVAGQLLPDLGYSRALYCRALARLRRDERRWEEALALGERAVALLDDHGSTLEIGQAQVEQGWILIEAGDPDDARPWLEAALPLLEGVPFWAGSGRLGLAVALADTGDLEYAGEMLALADRLTAAVMDPRERLRLRWRSAQAARRCGQSCSSLRRLCRVMAGFLELDEHHDAAGALLELLALSIDRQWWRVHSMTEVLQAVATLFDSPQLHRGARAVIGHVGWTLLDPDRRRGSEVLTSARRYLIESRYRPELPFRPLPPPRGPLFRLAWDELDPQLRQSIAVEVGAGEELGRRPSADLDIATRELIAWRYEVLRRVRITFAAGPRELPPA
jgi:tetratricopeptide (TPR) repeat protein